MSAALRGTQTAEGIYTTLLWGAEPPPTWPWHLQRLARDAAQLELAAPPLEGLEGEIAALLHRQPPAPLWRVRVRWWAEGGDPLRSAAPEGRWELHAQPYSPGDAASAAVALVSAGPARFGRRWAGAKVTAIGEDLAWRRWAQRRAGPEADALLCTDAGLWSETPTAALLAGLDGDRTVCIGPAAWPVRSTTLQALRAQPQGAAIAEVALGAADLPRLRWMALLNAVSGARAVARIDGQPLAPPPPAWLALARRLTQPAR